MFNKDDIEILDFDDVPNQQLNNEFKVEEIDTNHNESTLLNNEPNIINVEEPEIDLISNVDNQENLENIKKEDLAKENNFVDDAKPEFKIDPNELAPFNETELKYEDNPKYDNKELDNKKGITFIVVLFIILFGFVIFLPYIVDIIGK